jgi:hypothetical protein
MVRREDRALFGALLLVAAALFLCWAAPSPYNKEENGNQKCSTDECRDVLATEAVAEYTGGLFLVTAILAGASLWQGYFLIRSDKTTRIAAEATLERAYVFFEVLGTSIGFFGGEEGFPQGDSPPYITIRCINYGKTPAIIKEMNAELTLAREMTTPQFEAEQLSTPIVLPGIGTNVENGNSGGYPAPNFDYVQRLIANRKPTDAERVELREGKAFLWLSGRVVYDDVFGQEHRTLFWYRSKYGKGTSARMEPYGDLKYQRRT